MSGIKIAAIINKRLKENQLDIQISKSTANRILKQHLRTPRKVKKVFF